MVTEFDTHSSFLGMARYDETKETLRLEIGDYWYYYYGVTKQKVTRFRKATSRGKYFIGYIKGRYDSKRRKRI